MFIWFLLRKIKGSKQINPKKKLISFCVVAFKCIPSMIIKATKARGEVLSMWVLSYRGVDNVVHINNKTAIS